MVNRSRLIVEITKAIAAAIGQEKIGVRLSPFSKLCDQGCHDTDQVHQTYIYLASELDKSEIAYIHLSTSPEIPEKTYKGIRAVFHKTIIVSNGITQQTAEQTLQEGLADLVAFGRGFLANPDFVARIEKNVPSNNPGCSPLYSPIQQCPASYPLNTLK